jgi:hypothetical protein
MLSERLVSAICWCAPVRLDNSTHRLNGTCPVGSLLGQPNTRPVPLGYLVQFQDVPARCWYAPIGRTNTYVTVTGTCPQLSFHVEEDREPLHSLKTVAACSNHVRTGLGQ